MSGERTFAIVCAVLGLALWIYVLLLIAGCSRSVPSAEPSNDPPHPGTEYEVTCERESNETRRHGRLVGVRTVGSCRWRQP